MNSSSIKPVKGNVKRAVRAVPPVVLILLISASQPTLAVTLYWDGLTDTSWNTVANWSTSQTASTPDPAAVPGAADVANFVTTTATTTSTVNLNGAQAVLGLVTNASNTVTRTILGGGTNQTLSIGTNGIDHRGGGLTIGSSTAGQQVAISLQGSQNWISSAGGTGAAALIVNNNVSIGGGGNQNLNLTGTNLGSQANGIISDGAAVLSLSKGVNTGTWTLNGANTYSGSTTVNGTGTLVANHATALGSTVGQTSVVSGASLAVGSGITITGETLTLNGPGVNSIGALVTTTIGSPTWDGPIILAGGTARLGARAGRTLTVSGGISGVGQSLFFSGESGTGILRVSGAAGTNIYEGATNIVRGILRIGADNALPTTTVLDVHQTSATTHDATFDLNNFNQTVAGLQNTGGTNAVVTVTNSGASMKTLTVNSSADGTYSGRIISSNFALTKTGAAILTLSGANTYGGVTSINSGTLAIGAAGSIASSSEVKLGGGTLDVSAKGAGGLILGSTQKLSGSGTVTGNLTIDGTLAIGNSPGAVTFNDNLTLGVGSVSDFEFTDTAFTSGTFDLAQGTADTITFDGTLNLLFSGGSYANGSTVTIFTGFGTYSGSFDTVNFSGLNVGQSATFDSTSGTLTVVPEPTTMALSAFGLLAAFRSRRRLGPLLPD